MIANLKSKRMPRDPTALVSGFPGSKLAIIRVILFKLRVLGFQEISPVPCLGVFFVSVQEMHARKRHFVALCHRIRTQRRREATRCAPFYFPNNDVEENASLTNSIVLPLCNTLSELCALCVHFFAFFAG